MAKFKSGKKLWIGVVIIVLVALLTAFNFSSFRAAPSPDADEYVSSGVYSAYVAGPLSLDIGALARYIALFILMSAALLIEFRLPKKAETAVAWAFFAAGPFLTFEAVKLIIGVELFRSRCLSSLSRQGSRYAYLWSYGAFSTSPTRCSSS